jgi:hypothetical protein
VEIMDAKGAIFELEKLRRQLGSMIDALNTRIKVETRDRV